MPLAAGALWLAVLSGCEAEPEPGETRYRAAARAFAEGRYPAALDAYQAALEQTPGHAAAARGRAETLTVLGRGHAAVAAWRELLAAEPDNAVYHANLGIAYDRAGEHRAALRHYRRALRLEPGLADGPGWLQRLLYFRPTRPSGIAERTAYLEHQLRLPAAARHLREPALDDAQMPYRR